MKKNKTLLSIAVATALYGAIPMPVQAYTLEIAYDGLFTMLNPDGNVLQNPSYPYYDDPTWGYGFRTQITGTMSFDTVTGIGSGTITPFEFFNGGPAVPQDIQYQMIGGNQIIGLMNFAWGANVMMSSIVLDASGLFDGLDTTTYYGGVINQSSCSTLNCTLPASDGIMKGAYPIGPVPISTTSYNTVGDIGYGTTIDMLSLGTDDGIGGSPMQDSAFSGFSINYDITTAYILTPGAVPVPAAVWLFGSGLLGIIGMARRKSTKSSKHNV